MNRLVRTELLKQRTTRTFVAGIAAAPVIAGLVTIAILSAAGKQGNDPLSPDNLVQVLGAPAGAITLIAVLLGVVGTAGEYRHQTITTTFLASPRRRDVVIAKLAAHSLTGAVMAVLSLAVSTAIAVPWLRSSGVDIHVGGDTIRVAAGLVVSTALYGRARRLHRCPHPQPDSRRRGRARLAARRRTTHRRPARSLRTRALVPGRGRPRPRPRRAHRRQPLVARRGRRLQRLRRGARNRRRPLDPPPRHHLTSLIRLNNETGASHAHHPQRPRPLPQGAVSRPSSPPSQASCCSRRPAAPATSSTATRASRAPSIGAPAAPSYSTNVPGSTTRTPSPRSTATSPASGAHHPTPPGTTDPSTRPTRSTGCDRLKPGARRALTIFTVKAYLGVRGRCSSAR